jgi:hypothetical protein
MKMTSNAYKAHVAGFAVYANYDTSFAIRLTDMESLISIRGPGMLLIDEIHTLLDSRSFTKNAELTEWLMLLGKRYLSLHYTVQAFHMVDLRVRGLTTTIFTHQRLRGRSLVERLEVDPLGLGLRPRGRSFLIWAKWSHLYDTLDTRVRLGGTGEQKQEKLLTDSYTSKKDQVQGQEWEQRREQGSPPRRFVRKGLRNGRGD